MYNNVPTTPVSRILTVLVAALAGLSSACGPCEATIDVAYGVHAVDLCPGGDDGGDHGDGGGEGGMDVCGDAPAHGKIGGPCDAETPCEQVGDVRPVCQSWPAGSICSPPCPFTGTCGDIMCGAADACVPGAVCAASCAADDDCPHDGMVCSAGQCLWPHEDVEVCEGADVPGQPFAPCLADNTCDTPGTICATDGAPAVCIPVSSEGCADEFAACAGPGGFGKGYGAQVDACILACDIANGNADCPAGMVCGDDFGLCLWP